MLLEQRRRGHDLPGLAEAALRDAELDPRLLQRMTAVRREPLDGDAPLARGAANRRHAGAHHLAVEVHGARAAQRLAAAVLRAGEAEHVAQRPEQRHLGIDVELPLCAVDTKRDVHRRTSWLGHSAPVSTHAATIAPNCSWVPGAGSRSAPGDQPHATSACRARCARRSARASCRRCASDP